VREEARQVPPQHVPRQHVGIERRVLLPETGVDEALTARGDFGVERA
jgi:hypothetical protein